MKDAAFLAEADKQKIEINPMSGEQLQAIIADVVSAPRPVADKLASLLGGIGEGK